MKKITDRILKQKSILMRYLLSLTQAIHVIHLGAWVCMSCCCWPAWVWRCTNH